MFISDIRAKLKCTFWGNPLGGIHAVVDSEREKDRCASGIPLNMKDDTLYRDEKTGIMYRKWTCQSPQAVFLLVHGLGAFSGRWGLLADLFLQKDIASYAIELKGFGETEGVKGYIDSFNIYFNDILSLHDIIKREHSQKKIFLIGESMGALISFLLVVRKPDLFDGIICLSAAFGNRLKFSRLEKIRIFMCMVFNPRKQFTVPFNARMCTRDVAYQKVMDSDKREHRLTTPKLLSQILLAQMRVLFLKKKIKIPILFQVAGDFDALTDPRQVKKVFDGLKTEDKELIQYPQMYHSLSVELGREEISRDIIAWVEKRM